MKENRYDDERFFEKYAQMSRSVKGLQAAGEWPAFEKILPSFASKSVLDLGCGYGWHCIYAAEHGAARITGVDISEKMLTVAREKTKYGNVDYLRSPIEEIDFPPESFDVVISSLALHYIESFGDVCEKVRAILRKGGSFAFSCEHPIFTAQGPQDWAYDENGGIAHWPVDHYFSEGQRDAVFLGEHVKKYHRTLTTYVNTLIQSGFTLTNVVEPMPPEAFTRENGPMANELRRPMMLIICAVK
jgi:SAM-dependent methyltransferase